MQTPSLTAEERSRYARQTVLPEIGEAGQVKLKSARVLIIGLGGLGAPAALYLAAAGVGTLGLCDADTVDVSNLQRQVLYRTEDAGALKIDAAKMHLEALNPHIKINLHPQKFTAASASIIKNYDIVLDGTDNFAAHYLINDACVLSNKPLVYGNVHRFEGLAGVVKPRKGPCYRCLFPTAPPPELAPNCAEAGVLGVMPGMVGMLQATETLKLILGIGETLAGRIIRLDALRAGFYEAELEREPHCAVCGDEPTIVSLTDAASACAAIPEIAAHELKDALRSTAPPFLLDVREPQEFVDSRITGATLIPLSDLKKRLGELDRMKPIVAYCRSGKRSAAAAQILLDSGFTQVRSLQGGIANYF